jgi:hypothetical protein
MALIHRILLGHAVSATPWFAIIDAARAASAGLRTESLYAGELGTMVVDVAPHLVSFDFNSAFAQWLFDRWGGHHGILLQAKAPFDELRKHFRHYLLVKDEAGKKYRFRFYDPRVLRAFLPACSFEEAKGFFGPVDCYYAATREGQSVHAFGWGPRGLTTRELPPPKGA